MTKPQINIDELVESNWNLSASFPIVADPEIPRHDMLDTLLEVFTPSNPIVFLEGDSGIGATNTLAQFVREHIESCFSLFLSPASRFSYSLDYIRVKIAEQLKIFLDGTPFEKGAIDEAEYSTLINKARVKLKGKTVYFVVDGLNHIPLEDESYVASIMNSALPIGVEGFRFLISGPQIRFQPHLNRVGSKPYQLRRFTASETEMLFDDCGLNADELDDLKQLCRGNPGRLSAVRRQLKAGSSFEEIIQGNPEKYLDFVALDFKNFDALTENQKKIIATVTYSKQLVGLTEITEILSCTREDISATFSICTFIEKKSTNFVGFISNAHRKLAESKLRGMQSAVNDLQIEYLKRAPDSDTSLLFLATYLQQANNNQELVELISSEHYHDLLDSTQSLTQLKNRAELGLISSHELKDAMSSFQFALQKSLFIDLLKSSASKAEIDALVAIGKNQHAMMLVESAVTKLSKLSLLAAYASGLKKKSKNIDSFLMGQIVDLATGLNFSEEGTTGLQIAEDLLHVDVNLATDTLEKCLSNNDVRQRDMALSRLSITASQGKNAFATASVESKIKSKAVQAFTSAFTHFHKNDSADSIIELLKSAPVKNKIRLLIEFISHQTRREGLINLIDYTLDLIIKDSSYLPKAKDYADLAAPLKYFDADLDRLAELITRFNGQSGLIKNASVSRDWVRLSTTLAYAEAKFSPESAYERILNSYYDVCQLTNQEIQTECYARLLYALKDIDPDDAYEKKEGLKAVIDEGLKKAVSELLRNAASQHDCIQSILPAMVEHDLPEAVNLVRSMNTEDNRNDASRQVLELLVKGTSSTTKSEIFNAVLSKVQDQQSLHEILLSCTKILWQRDFNAEWAATLKKSVLRIRNSSVYARCAINVFRAYGASGQPLDPAYVTQAIERMVEKTAPTAGRNDICFRAVEAISEVAPDVADDLYTKTIELRGNAESVSIDVQMSFIQCLCLVSRAFGAALKRNALEENMLRRLSTAIDRLTSVKQQMGLYTDLACRAWVADNMLQTIVADYCRPLLENTKRNNNYLYLELLEIAFPALYVAHAESALREVEQLDTSAKNAALYNACELIRRRLTNYDPPQTDDNDIYQINMQQSNDILSLLEHMTHDGAIHLVVKKFVASASHKKNKHKFTQQQKRDLSDRLIKLAELKLPDPDNIQHDGYKICVVANAYSLTDTGLSYWKALIDQAYAIPNVADRAFVLIQIARSLPGKDLELRKSVLEQAEVSSEAIPSLSDKLGRLEMYSLACKDLNVSTAKRILRKSLELSYEIDNVEAATEIQRSLIDAADQIEPGFADALLELFDDDPARALAKAHAKHNVEVIKAKKNLADFCSGSQSSSVSDDYLAEASWKNLSSLLASRITPKPLFTMAGLISTSSSLGLGETYPFLCWYIENAARKVNTTDEAKSQIQPLCEILLLSTELAFSIVRKRVITGPKVGGDQSVVSFMVKPNTRAEALDFIQTWLNLNCLKYIKYCDPYFTADDIELVQLIQAANPTCVVHIIASAAYLKTNHCASNEAFELAWCKLSDQTAPETYIYGIDKLDGKELIHDRWLLSSGGGLRLGTSINSLGAKFSEISVMTPNDLTQCELELNSFLENQVYVNGSRVKVTRYQL